MAIEVSERFFPSTSKAGVNIRYLVWKDTANKKPVGVIQLTHGWGEHIERYDEMARLFVKNGYVVCGQDHLGHGHTATVPCVGLYPEDAGTAMIEDMHELRKIMQAEYKKLPYMLFGHSLGSMMVRDYIMKYSKGLSACVICGTVPTPNFAFLLSAPLHLLYKLTPASFEKSCARARKKRSADDTTLTKKPPLYKLIATSWISFDKQNIITYNQSPYTYVAPDLSLLNMIATCLNTGKPFWAFRANKKVPYFVCSGKYDICGVHCIGPKKVYKELKRAGRNVQLKIYPNAKHEIHNETENGTKLEVYADLLKFFNDNNPLLKK